MLKWPDSEAVQQALTRWAGELARTAAGVMAVGYFGSYARGDWGVGSDVDVVVIVDQSSQPFERRAAKWDATGLPVPADLLVYTQAEWVTLPFPPRDVVWVVGGGLVPRSPRRV